MPATTNMLNYILKYYFGSIETVGVPPPTMYFGMSTTEVTAAGYSSVTEPATANNYSRVSMTNNTTTWNTPASGATSNKGDITFPVCQTASWGKIISLFIIDSATGPGTLGVLWYLTLNPSIVIQVGTQIVFDGDVTGGAISVTVS